MSESSWKLKEFIHAVPLASSTLAVYQRDLEAFVSWADRFGVSSPDAVTRVTLRRYLATLTTKAMAPRTIARKAAAIRRYFAWMTLHGLLATDPSAGISSPRGPAKLPRILTADELQQLIDEPSAAALAQPAVAARASVWVWAASIRTLWTEFELSRTRSPSPHGLGQGL
jgi:site-specific recombinase XerC